MKRRAVMYSVAIIAIVVLVVGCGVGCYFIGRASGNKGFDGMPEWVYASMDAEDNSYIGGASLRIMSYNVLVEAWGGDDIVGVPTSEPTMVRADMFGYMLKHYKPDVVGLQEVCEKWHKYLPDFMGNYRMLAKKSSNYTTMIYNTETLELIENGMHKFSEHTSGLMRYIVWGLFKEKASGKEFIVTTTHLDFGENKKEIQQKQIEETKELVSELTARFDVPAFITGDFNALEYSEEDASDVYKAMLKDGYSFDAKFVEGIVKRSKSEESFALESWDHIFVKGDAKVTSFTILDREIYDSMSDHYPVFAEVVL